VISVLLDSSNWNFKMNVTPFFDDDDEKVALNTFFAFEGAPRQRIEGGVAL
jgi:hypothetical protein